MTATEGAIEAASGGRRAGSPQDSDRTERAIHWLDQEISYQLIRSPRRKRLAVQVTQNGEVQLRIPQRFPAARAEAFLIQQASWVVGRLEAARNAQAKRAARRHLQDGFVYPLLEESVRLSLRPMRPTAARRVGGELWASERLAAEPDQLEGVLERWFRQGARRALEPRLEAWSEKLELPYQRLTLRSQRSRWGSCSSRGGISLNWRLVWLPGPVVDYVLVHELCHLRHMDHSPAFWDFVERCAPGLSRQRQALKRFEPFW